MVGYIACDTLLQACTAQADSHVGVIILPIFSKAVCVCVHALKGLALAAASVLFAHAVVTETKIGRIISLNMGMCNRLLQAPHIFWLRYWGSWWHTSSGDSSSCATNCTNPVIHCDGWQIDICNNTSRQHRASGSINYRQSGVSVMQQELYFRGLPKFWTH